MRSTKSVLIDVSRSIGAAAALGRRRCSSPAIPGWCSANAGLLPDQSARMPGSRSEPAHTEHRKQALQDRREADQRDQDLEQVPQSSVAHILVDEIEQDRADDDDDNDVDQDHEHDGDLSWLAAQYVTKWPIAP